MTRKDANQLAHGTGPEERGGNPRLLTILGTAIVAGALLLAWQLDRDRAGRRGELRASIIERNEMMLESVSANLVEYFEGVRTVSQMLALDPQVAAYDPAAREQIAATYDILWERHGLSALHVTPAGSRGLPRPAFAFSHGAARPVAPDSDAPPNELLAEREHLRAFAADPELESLLSPLVLLCGDDAGTPPMPGFVYSVPIRRRGELKGLVAVTIPRDRLTALLERGSIDGQTLLINDRGEVFSGGEVAPETADWLRARTARRCPITVVRELESDPIGEGYHNVWADLDLAAGAGWWLLVRADVDAQLQAASGDGPLSGRGFSLLVTLTGLALAAALLLLKSRLEDRFENLRLRARDEEILQSVAEGTMGATGEEFFRGLAKSLSKTFDAQYAFVGRVDPDDPGAGRTLAFWDGSEFTPSIHYVLAGTPSDIVMKRGRFYCPDDAQIQFPDDDLLHTLGVCSYNGVTLYDSDGQACGIMAVMDTKPMPRLSSRVQSFLEIFAGRASAELIRLGTEWRTQQLNVELERRVEKRTNELREAQDQLVEAEKMSALGTLVAGVAHEINTPVGIGVTAITHLQDKLAACEASYADGGLKRNQLEAFLAAVRETAGLVFTNLKRAAELITIFKQVAVDQDNETPRPLEMEDFLRETLGAVRSALEEKGHRLVIDCPRDLKITTWPGALTRVLTQLISNSVIHGFNDGRHGEVILTVTSNGPSWRLAYQDDGLGMDPETIRRVYEPFYTTRRGASGTGLGMHIVYNTVTRTLGGTIRCESRPEQGTRFEIVCPHEVHVPADAGVAS